MIDPADPPAVVQPNLPSSTLLEVVFQGRYDAATQSITTYEPLVVAANTGKISIVAVTEIN